MLAWLKSLGNRGAASLPDAIWASTLAAYPFLGQRAAADQNQLRLLSGKFLKSKEFGGAQGLVVTDSMAVAIAAQACLPVLHLGLGWYDDFTGIVVHPGAMLARRTQADAAGVVHHYREALLGEAMQGGPVTLSWQAVADSAVSAEQGQNVVVHEFIHKIDMRDGQANGCPPQPSRRAEAVWQQTMQPAYDAFCEQVTMAERFGAESPWLDAYGATAPAEFFAVTCEAYFVNRQRFVSEFPNLVRLYDQYFG